MQYSFYEYDSKTYDTLLKTHASGLKAFLESKGLGKAFNFSLNTIETTSYVGSLKYKNIQINVLPKILGGNNSSLILDNLIYMLSYTNRLKIKKISNSSLSKSRNPFIEILIAYFAEELFSALLKHMPHSYENKSDNLHFIKGKIDFKNDIKHNMFNKSRVYCNFDEFQEDNLLNRLFKFVSFCLFNMTEVQATKNKLSKILGFYQDVELTKITPDMCRKIVLNRGQSIFEDALKTAKLFLDNSSINFSNQNFDSIAILFDMNILFEEFMFKIIKRLYPENLVLGQEPKAFIKCIKGHKEYDINFSLSTKCDILITAKDGKNFLIDTKYKILDKQEEGNKSNISQADIYQMLTYSKVYNSKDIILLYPLVNYDFNHNVVFAEETNLADIRLHILTVNLNENLKDTKFKIEFKNILENIIK